MLRASQPATEGGKRFYVAAGDEIVQSGRAFWQQVENQLAHRETLIKQGP